MKHNYESMSIDDLCDLYDETFSLHFAVKWGDELSSHRQEIIDCIESGIPKDIIGDAIKVGRPWKESDGEPSLYFVQ